eukprot:gene20745-26897_t
MDITEYESSLAAAIEAKSGAYVNIPGAFYHLVQLTAHEISADVILIDTSPSLEKRAIMQLSSTPPKLL